VLRWVSSTTSGGEAEAASPAKQASLEAGFARSIGGGEAANKATLEKNF